MGRFTRVRSRRLQALAAPGLGSDPRVRAVAATTAIMVAMLLLAPLLDRPESTGGTAPPAPAGPAATAPAPPGPEAGTGD